ncbi:MAG: hypothetical protein F4Y79_09530 [Gemmatimonadetes bacterium]|nr:hypothetical protein [Gemmatimonadota bacterium]
MKFAEFDMKFQRDLDTILDNWSPITRRWRKNSGDLANTNSLIPKIQRVMVKLIKEIERLGKLSGHVIAHGLKEGIVLYERG